MLSMVMNGKLSLGLLGTGKIVKRFLLAQRKHVISWPISVIVNVITVGAGNEGQVKS